VHDQQLAAEAFAYASLRQQPGMFAVAAIMSAGKTPDQLRVIAAGVRGLAQVTLFTRGESYFENALFSDPTGWTSLTMEERRDALARTDRGVFSARVQDALLSDDRIIKDRRITPPQFPGMKEGRPIDVVNQRRQNVIPSVA